MRDLSWLNFNWKDMMLKLRPNCEYCDMDLPPDSNEAMICSFECTFCQSCVTQVLKGVCPNCGGDFCSRPTRDIKWLDKHPPSSKRILNKIINRG
jgi:hypothetical protein